MNTRVLPGGGGIFYDPFFFLTPKPVVATCVGLSKPGVMGRYPPALVGLRTTFKQKVESSHFNKKPLTDLHVDIYGVELSLMFLTLCVSSLER